MDKWKEILIPPSTSIISTMEIIDKAALQIAVVVDKDMSLLGTVTDGDIRRGILRGVPLETSIKEVMNSSPTHIYEGQNQIDYQEFLFQLKLKQLPIVDEKKRVVNIIFSDEYNQVVKKDNVVVLMVGGLGTRLHPLTNDIPKPMLKVGNKPILETIIEGFKSYGFSNFILSVNYKRDIIKEYFRDGCQLGVNISYIDESQRLGTAGALSLLKNRPDRPFFVMNGDLLTKINYDQMLDFHVGNKSVATMCVREYEYQIPYGVIETENYRLLSIEEKPIHRSFVNAGIYVLDPDVLQSVPNNTFFDMPELFKLLMNEKKKVVSAFPLREYWLDIGRIDDYERANEEFSGVF